MTKQPKQEQTFIKGAGKSTPKTLTWLAYWYYARKYQSVAKWIDAEGVATELRTTESTNTGESPIKGLVDLRTRMGHIVAKADIGDYRPMREALKAEGQRLLNKGAEFDFSTNPGVDKFRSQHEIEGASLLLSYARIPVNGPGMSGSRQIRR